SNGPDKPPTDSEEHSEQRPCPHASPESPQRGYLQGFHLIPAFDEPQLAEGTRERAEGLCEASSKASDSNISRREAPRPRHRPSRPDSGHPERVGVSDTPGVTGSRAVTLGARRGRLLVRHPG